MKGLMLHCGGMAVDRGQLEVIPTPEATATWQPIPHGTLVSRVQDTLERSGLIVAEEAHGVTADGNRYFGLLRIKAESVIGDGGDFGLVVGVRNSHDKSFPAGLVVGASVFVSDNLSFSGEIKIARKHTVRIMDDLPNLIADGSAPCARPRSSASWLTRDTRSATARRTTCSFRLSTPRCCR